MIVKVGAESAARLLAEATARASEGAYSLPSQMETKIEQILGHTHLTYKYILLNGMLAKATNPEANPLVLQAGSSLPGAFDARSLCHNVVVPFEQTVLEKRLGGSNEPFLNKPARFPHLSLENAVRRGKDKETLVRLIEVFELVNARGNAFDALTAVVAHILALESRTVSFDPTRFAAAASKRALIEVFDALLEQSCEGESLALGVALAFELMLLGTDSSKQVKSHPANQSGSSSNETSDIDVFEADGSTLAFCCEAKDKPFTRSDIEHATSKVAEANHHAMIFVYGPNGRTSENLDALVIEHEVKGFDLTFVDAMSFAKSMISLAPSISWGAFTSLVNKHLAMMRAKEPTIAHCKSILAKV